MKQSLVVTNDQYRQIDQREHDHKRRSHVPSQAEELLQFHARRKARVMPHPPKQFYSDLNDALGPSTLLRLESVYLDRKLRGHVIVGKINKVPAHQLGAIGEVSVLGKRVVLPAA